jgi:adenylosuccinate synthase
MKVAVIGTGYGDEGKGITTDYLCHHFLQQNIVPQVVRYSGGQQAGHTVCIEDKRHVFSNFGSGTLRNVPTVWANLCTFDPVSVMYELRDLKSKECNPLLYVHPKCPVTTPYDKYANQNCEDNLAHGTCGHGVGKTWQREQDYYSLLFEDLMIPSIINIKMKQIANYYGNPNIDLTDFYNSIADVIRSQHIGMYLHDTSETFIYESSQGLLLDQDIGFFPHVTRSRVGSFELPDIDHYYLVTRAYQCRHGNGPMTNEDISHNILFDPNETNQTNTYQGEFRRTLLDIDLLQYAIYKDNLHNQHKTLVITCLDHMVNDYRFTLNGKIVSCSNEKDFVNKIRSSIEMNFDDVLLSRSPFSEGIMPINPKPKLTLV